VWEAAGVRKLSAHDGFRSMLLSLWDTDARCYVPFPEWAWLDKILTRRPDGLMLAQQPASETVAQGKKQE
jgi:hypothetical protein